MRHTELWSTHYDESAMLRYEDYARWSTPSVFPPVLGSNNNQIGLEHDYQSDIGQMTTALANKLMVSLFPFNKAFFSLDGGDDAPSTKSELNKAVDRACGTIFRYTNYAKLVEALQYLIVTGNALLYRDPASGHIVAYSPRRYCVRRDWAGTAREVVIKETVKFADLPRDLQLKLTSQGYHAVDRYADLVLWTYVTLEDDVYTETAYIDRFEMHTTSAPRALCPYIPAVWKLISGEHMGRGLVEDNAGSIAKYSELSRGLTLYEAEALRLRNMVPANAQVDIKQFNGAGIGDFVEGDGNAITAYEGGQANKIQQIAAELTLLEQKLQRAFMYTGSFRDAERVTQEEIRQVVRAAEETFGGAYSQLGATLHTALAHLTMQDTEPMLAAAMRDSSASMSIKTGLAAMSRSYVTDAWLATAQELSVIIPAVQQLLPTQDTVLLAKQLAEANGIDLRDTARSEEDMQAAQAPTGVEQMLGAAELPQPGVLQ